MTTAADPFSLEGKRILVTGASSGLGRAIAIGAAAAGAEVVLTGRDPTRLAETRAAMGGTGHLCVPADLTDAGERDTLVRESGTVHGLVHCAGTAAVRLLRQVDQTFIDRDFGINFDAPVLLTQRLLATRQLAHGGSIVFIGSIAAHIGTLASSIYSASKAALRPAGRSLALEVGPKQKIRVNYVAVSYVETPMLARLAQQGMGASMEAHTEPPLGKGTPEDVSHSAVFLLADASRWITRATLYVDGGLTCQISAQ